MSLERWQLGGLALVWPTEDAQTGDSAQCGWRRTATGVRAYVDFRSLGSTTYSVELRRAGTIVGTASNLPYGLAGEMLNVRVPVPAGVDPAGAFSCITRPVGQGGGIEFEWTIFGDPIPGIDVCNYRPCGIARSVSLLGGMADADTIIFRPTTPVTRPLANVRLATAGGLDETLISWQRGVGDAWPYRWRDMDHMFDGNLIDGRRLGVGGVLASLDLGFADSISVSMPLRNPGEIRQIAGLSEAARTDEGSCAVGSIVRGSFAGQASVEIARAMIVPVLQPGGARTYDVSVSFAGMGATIATVQLLNAAGTVLAERVVTLANGIAPVLSAADWPTTAGESTHPKPGKKWRWSNPTLVTIGAGASQTSVVATEARVTAEGAVGEIGALTDLGFAQPSDAANFLAEGDGGAPLPAAIRLDGVCIQKRQNAAVRVLVTNVTCLSAGTDLVTLDLWNTGSSALQFYRFTWPDHTITVTSTVGAVPLMPGQKVTVTLQIVTTGRGAWIFHASRSSCSIPCCKSCRRTRSATNARARRSPSRRCPALVRAMESGGCARFAGRRSSPISRRRWSSRTTPRGS